MDHQLLREAFSAEGLEFLGVASVPDADRPDPAQGAREGYRNWLAEGRHGTMAFLERHEAGKYTPEFSLAGTRSVIVAGLGYQQQRAEPTAGAGLVARYAWGRDYHKVVRTKLQRVEAKLAALWPAEGWRCFTDTAPLDERWWAARAGATFTARNALAINHRLGSWFLLGEILSTYPFAPTAATDQGSCPSGCRRCHDVCPTGALDPGGRLDARRCVSYLTIEHRGPIDDGLKDGIGSWLFGCDLCQQVCPFNLKVATTGEPEFLAWRAGPEIPLAEVLALDKAGFTTRFGGSPVHRAGRDGLVRNACLVAANQGRQELLPRLTALADDPDPGVADAAAWACHKLQTKESP